MGKREPMVGDMTFEEFNRLSYQEQCEYINTLKPIATEGVDDMPLQEIEIDCTFEEFAAKYHLVSLDELKRRLCDTMDEALKRIDDDGNPIKQDV